MDTDAATTRAILKHCGIEKTYESAKEAISNGSCNVEFYNNDKAYNRRHVTADHGKRILQILNHSLRYC